MDKKKSVKNWKISLIVLSVFVFVYLIWFFSSYEKVCDDLVCFQDSMKNCQKASLIKEDDSGSWLYRIKGSEGSDCKVRVTLLSLKDNSANKNNILVGNDMVCTLPRGSVRAPEGELNNCHGILKERMQEIIIQRMHNYLLENLGKIEENFEGV